jgi:NAD(P)H-hydrate epimerase
MVLPLPETPDGTIALGASTLLEEQCATCDATVLGPGLDENEETRVLQRRLAMEMPLPLVLDATALLVHSDAQHTYLHPRIITSSQQKFEVIYGAAPTAARETRVLEYVQRSQGDVTLVLQGRQTLVASKPDMLYGNAEGTRGLGSAGSGDVLAGIIGGLLAQFVAQKVENSATRAALWGVHLHALCGEAVEKDLGDDGMIASDLITRLAGVLRFLRKQTDPKHEAHFGLRPKL